MFGIATTPLEKWIREKARIGAELQGRSFLEALQYYQLQRLNEVIEYARSNSPFYRHHFTSLQPASLTDLSDIRLFPFTTPSHLTLDPFRFLAVHQNDVARIVTLHTSGSTGETKRLFFTETDLELTIDFFHHGRSTLVRPGQKVMIFLPGEKPDSVGDLLKRGLRRMDVHAFVYGPVTDPANAAKSMADFGADSLVGIPTQVLGVARSFEGTEIGRGNIKSVLLSTDYVPLAIVRSLEEIWGCRVFNHYGMTEMGLGGGVECDALDGYHVREADLYFEVVDHKTGKVCPDGTLGEVVFTTLTRKGMPLIRYRTGDIARIIPQPCPCGSSLRRLARVKGRWDSLVHLGPDCTLTLPDMDEVLFRLTDLLDYHVTMSRGEDGIFKMLIDVYKKRGSILSKKDILEAIENMEVIQKGVENGILKKPIVRLKANGSWSTTGVSKRNIRFVPDLD